MAVINKIKFKSLSKIIKGQIKSIKTRFKQIDINKPVLDKNKIFCIGCNKTGTTSLEQAFKDFGYKLGNQPKGEELLDSYLERDFEKIIKFCSSADVFQDAPFSFPHTYVALHQAFPNAKFILSVRDSDEQWYDSMVNFHTKTYGKLPDYDMIKNSNYRYPGYMWKVRSRVFGITRDMKMYDKQIFTNYYNSHNHQARNYFNGNPNFLEINISSENSYFELAEFIGCDPLYDKFPWKNKS